VNAVRATGYCLANPERSTWSFSRKQRRVHAQPGGRRAAAPSGGPAALYCAHGPQTNPTRRVFNCEL